MKHNLDTLLIAITAMVWLCVALIYHFVSLIDMPDAERVWSASSIVFLAILLWVRAADRRGARLRALAARRAAEAAQ